MSIFFYIICTILIIYAAMNAYLYFFQRSILYLPAKNMSDPKHYGLYDAENVTLTTKDGFKLVSWYLKPKKYKPFMVYLHGNAGNLGDRTEKIAEFVEQGFGLLAVSWRGYASSEGQPSEEGLYNDARSAIDYLLDQDVPLNDIFIYGESLGTGVAIQMALEYNVRNIVLEAPYTSIANRAAELYPYIPVKLVLKDHYKSIDKISSVNIPVLVLHGYRDEVMPISHGRRILNKANEPKEARFFENIGHTDFDFNEIAQITYDFVEKHK